MFISREEIRSRTGYDVTQETLSVAQLMIESWVGRDEAEVDDARDLETLGRATLFQAVYIGTNKKDIMEQAAVKSIRQGETSTTFDNELFAPYMSPWAIKACEKLSWTGSRSIHTGSLLGGQRTNWRERWLRD